MSKFSIGKIAASTAKKSAQLAGKAAKVSGKAVKTSAKYAVKAGHKVMTLEMPNSLNWIYSFGFKVGVFLILKSFLILRYQFFNLQTSGLIMVASQFIQALILIACGALMQNKALYDEPLKLRKISHYYGIAVLLGLIIFTLRSLFDWQFFREPKAVNWFIDFFGGISKGISEFSLSLLFWDCDLWGAFCGLLYFITTVYLHVSFDYVDGFWAKIFDRVHFLREAHNTAELLEDPVFEEIE